MVIPCLLMIHDYYVTSNEPGGFMPCGLVVLCPGTPEGSTGRGSGLKRPKLKVLFDRLGEPWIELGTPGYKASGSTTTSCILHRPAV